MGLAVGAVSGWGRVAMAPLRTPARRVVVGQGTGIVADVNVFGRVIPGRIVGGGPDEQTRLRMVVKQYEKASIKKKDVPIFLVGILVTSATAIDAVLSGSFGTGILFGAPGVLFSYCLIKALVSAARSFNALLEAFKAVASRDSGRDDVFTVFGEIKDDPRREEFAQKLFEKIEKRAPIFANELRIHS